MALFWMFLSAFALVVLFVHGFEIKLLTLGWEPTIPDVNRRHIDLGDEFFEGDIKLPRVRPRGGIFLKAETWPYIESSGHYEVPYTIDSDFSEDQVTNVIEYGMKLLERGSNVRFIPYHASNSLDDRHYVRIINGRGCYSFLGVERELNTSYQELSLEIGDSSATCMLTGTVVHELMHLLGIGHEHQRPDRGRYIRVNFDRVDEEYKSQLEIMDSLDHGACTPYDYASLVHYDIHAFGISPSVITLYPLLETGSYSLQARKLTPSSCDWYEINALYPKGGYQFSCKPHEMPAACVPRYPGKPCEGIFPIETCEEFCTLRCQPDICVLPAEFPPVPHHHLKPANMTPLEECTNPINGAYGKGAHAVKARP